MVAQDKKNNDRTLTDADVDAIVTRAESAITKRFYLNLGKGMWGLIWKAVLLGLLSLAAYGAWTGRH